MLVTFSLMTSQCPFPSWYISRVHPSPFGHQIKHLLSCSIRRVTATYRLLHDKHWAKTGRWKMAFEQIAFQLERSYLKKKNYSSTLLTTVAAWSFKSKRASVDSKINHRVWFSKWRTRILSGLQCLAAQQALGAFSFQVETWKLREAPQTTCSNDMLCRSPAHRTGKLFQLQSQRVLRKPLLLVTFPKLSCLPRSVLIGDSNHPGAASISAGSHSFSRKCCDQVTAMSGKKHLGRRQARTHSFQVDFFFPLFFFKQMAGLASIWIGPQRFYSVIFLS